MQSNFTDDAFEQFLKQSADSCRMRPSEEVWKGISKHLNDRKRKVRFTTGAFLVAASLLGFFLADSSKNINQHTATASAEVNNTSTSPSQKALPGKETTTGAAIKAPGRSGAVIREIPSLTNAAAPAQSSFARATELSTSFSENRDREDGILNEPARVIPLFKPLSLASLLKEQYDGERASAGHL